MRTCHSAGSIPTSGLIVTAASLVGLRLGSRNKNLGPRVRSIGSATKTA
jgi:hypothetical protein